MYGKKVVREKIDTTGDANALDYGGGVVYRAKQINAAGEIEHEWVAFEWWDGLDQIEGNTVVEVKLTTTKRAIETDGWHLLEDEIEHDVYRVDVPEDVCKEWDWADWAAVAESCSWDLDELKANAIDPDIMKRVAVIESLVGYYGEYEVTGGEAPIKMRGRELKERWPHLK
jgi:hypothetical protein